MIGRTLLHYRIADKVGEGGMGTVYKALDTHLDRPVAIKVLPPDKVADPERKQRFVQEAKAASALRHPNIVVIHDIAEDRGRDFIVMEFVEGRPLDRLIGRRGLPLATALGFAVQIADGLARAHAAGIVHRDLKPTNIMVTDDGLVKILDFGLAKLLEEEAAPGGPTMTMGRDDQPHTEEGDILGTAAYMSPEQAEGKKVDARSDVFAFGAVLYEMLTGRKAFDRGSRIKTLAAVLSEEPAPAATVNEALPPEVERIIGRCLRKDPQRRWQTVSDLRVALQDMEEDSESGRLQAAAAPRGRKRNGLLLAAAASLVVLAAAAVVLLVARKAQKGAVGYEVMPLTFDQGFSGSPTVSADGSLMAYFSDREGNGNYDIWVQQVSGGKPLRLTDHPADDLSPSFAPDGSQVAFRSDRDGGGIYLIDALASGGEPRKVADKGLLPKFSPDGRLILYLVLPASLESELYRMFVVSPKGGEPRLVLEGFLYGYVEQGGSPVWSPDGKSLLFQGRRADDPSSMDWWVAPVEGGESVRTRALENLGLGPASIVHYPVGWVGNSVYFVSGTTIEGVNLYRASIDPKTRAIAGPVQAITAGPGMNIYPAVMPDGRVFFTEMTAAMNAWSVSARTDEGLVSAGPVRLARDIMQNFTPAVSRDGSRAAFTAFGGAQAARFELRLLNLRTGDEARLPSQAAILFQRPRLSPDGALVAYLDRVEGKTSTFLVAAEGVPARRLCENCFVPGFFPGNAFALVRRKPNELEKMDIRTGESSVVLASAPDDISDASVSPDGNWIAWLAGLPDGRAAIRVSPVETPSSGPGGTVTVAEADYYLGNPDWSPNGRWLYYLSEKNGRASIFARELEPRTKRPVGAEREVYASMESRLNLNFPKGNGMIGVAADRIVFEAGSMTGNVCLAKTKKP